MASLGLAPDEFKQLEMVRNRFVQLAESLKSAHASVYHSDPLPSPERLQNSLQILRTSINSIQELIDDNASLFHRLTIHPSTNFPGRTHEHILQHLLRKKLEPDVEGLVEEARDTARAAGLDASKLGGGGARAGYGEDNNYGLDEEGVGDEEDDVPSDPLNEHWADIREACFDAIKDYAMNQSREAYTIEEQAMGTKNVRTGLKRSLEEDSDEEDDDDEEDEDEDEDMDGGAAAGNAAARPGQGALPGGTARLEPEYAMCFILRGKLDLAKNVELSSQRKEKKVRKPGPGMPGSGSQR